MKITNIITSLFLIACQQGSYKIPVVDIPITNFTNLDSVPTKFHSQGIYEKDDFLYANLYGDMYQINRKSMDYKQLMNKGSGPHELQTVTSFFFKDDLVHYLGMGVGKAVIYNLKKQHFEEDQKLTDPRLYTLSYRQTDQFFYTASCGKRVFDLDIFDLSFNHIKTFKADFFKDLVIEFGPRGWDATFFMGSISAEENLLILNKTHKVVLLNKNLEVDSVIDLTQNNWYNTLIPFKTRKEGMHQVDYLQIFNNDILISVGGQFYIIEYKNRSFYMIAQLNFLYPNKERAAAFGYNNVTKIGTDQFSFYDTFTNNYIRLSIDEIKIGVSALRDDSPFAKNL